MVKADEMKSDGQTTAMSCFYLTLNIWWITREMKMSAIRYVTVYPVEHVFILQSLSLHQSKLLSPLKPNEFVQKAPQ